MVPHSPRRIRVSIYAVLALLGAAAPASAEIVITETGETSASPTPLLDGLSLRDILADRDDPEEGIKILPPMTAAPNGVPPLAFAQTPVPPYTYGYWYSPYPYSVGTLYAPPPGQPSRPDAGAAAGYSLSRAHDWSQYKGTPVYSPLYSYGYYDCRANFRNCGSAAPYRPGLIQGNRADNRDNVNYLLRRSHAFSRNAYDR